MPTERAIEEVPSQYRLCEQREGGQLVLQAGYAWAQIDDDLNETSGIEWRTVPTHIEGGA